MRVTYMGAIQYKNFEQLSLADIMVYNSIPPHPFWDKVNEVIDFSFADKICEPLYSPIGQRPYAPSLKLKIHLVQRYYDISDREMELKIIGDIFVKRFLGLPVAHSKFDHSTIGLDRDRLGAEMFHACHVFILAQALHKGLWGEEDDRWLVDSFHTNARVSTPGTFELIQQAAGRLVRYVEKHNPTAYERITQEMDVQKLSQKLKNSATKRDRDLAFSELVVQSYGLVAWFRRINEDKESRWASEEEQRTAKELCELLLRILRENTTGSPDGGNKEDGEMLDSGDELRPASDEGTPVYVELPKDKKPTDRIVNAFAPEIRAGFKSSKKSFVGDKVQVVESAKSRLVLLAEPIAGNEPDGAAIVDLVQMVSEEFGVRPKEVVADKGYAWGKNFQQMALHGQRLVTPVPHFTNPTGKIPNTEFRYDPEQQTVTCPQGQTTSHTTRIAKSEGRQFKFPHATCEACPLKEECVGSQKAGNKFGRTVFVSDYAPFVEEVRAYLQTPEGKAALQARYEIERTNNEFKNPHGLAKPRARTRSKLRTTVKLTSIVINMKVMVKSLTRPPKPQGAPVCA